MGRGGHGGPGGMFLGMFDTDADGKVSREEFDARRGELFALADTDGNGSFTLQDFGPLWLSINENRVVDMFQRADADGSLGINDRRCEDGLTYINGEVPLLAIEQDLDDFSELLEDARLACEAHDQVPADVARRRHALCAMHDEALGLWRALQDGGDLAAADFLLGCGYNDDQTETLADYQDRLQTMLDNDVLMVCVNPDYEVLSGDRRLPCAGSLTLRYDEMGGRSIWYGKPFPVAYSYCMAEFGDVAPDRVLMIGDTIRTDIIGARDSGLDSVLVASGLHGRDFIVDGELKGDRVSEACAAANVSPVGYMAELAW